MGAAEMQEIAAIIATVLRATAPTSLANYTLDEAARSEAEGRARDLLGRFPLYPEIEL
jgi:glycine hydroxymethyltransferase